jgi:predicted patatin/cPLA2 family phospholipase
LSDKTVLIRTAEEVAAKANTATTATKTWYYKLKMLEIYHGHHHQLYFRWSK